MLHPVLVVAIGEVLARMRAAAFGAVERRVHGDHRLHDEVVELERLDQVGIPDQRTVGDLDVGHRVVDLVDQLRRLPRSISPVRNTAQLFCITFCMRSAQLRGRRLAVGVAELVEPRQREVGGILRQVRLLLAGMHELGAAMRGGAAEHHEVDQRVRAEPVGAVHRDAAGLAERHQAGHDGVVVAVLLGQHLAVIVRGDAAHVVVHGRHDRDRLARHVDAGEDARAIPRCRAAARAGSPDRDGRGAGGCGPCACRRRGPRGSRWSSRARPRRARRGPWPTARSAP